MYSSKHVVWLCVCLVLQVHLHEQAGLVYVDSDGGCVTAWLSPSGTPLGLQVKAAGGVVLDPALKVGGATATDMDTWCMPVGQYAVTRDVVMFTRETLCSSSEARTKTWPMLCNSTRMFGHTARLRLDAPDAVPLMRCLWQSLATLCVHRHTESTV